MSAQREIRRRVRRTFIFWVVGFVFGAFVSHYMTVHWWTIGNICPANSEREHLSLLQSRIEKLEFAEKELVESLESTRAVFDDQNESMKRNVQTCVEGASSCEYAFNEVVSTQNALTSKVDTIEQLLVQVEAAVSQHFPVLEEKDSQGTEAELDNVNQLDFVRVELNALKAESHTFLNNLLRECNESMIKMNDMHSSITSSVSSLPSDKIQSTLNATVGNFNSSACSDLQSTTFSCSLNIETIIPTIDVSALSSSLTSDQRFHVFITSLQGDNYIDLDNFENFLITYNNTFFTAGDLEHLRKEFLRLSGSDETITYLNFFAWLEHDFFISSSSEVKSSFTDEAQITNEKAKEVAKIEESRKIEKDEEEDIEWGLLDVASHMIGGHMLQTSPSYSISEYMSHMDETDSSILPSLSPLHNFPIFRMLSSMEIIKKYIFADLFRVLGLETGFGVPNDAISSDMRPGSCWPMNGTSGYAIIQLTQTSLVSSVSISHPIQNAFTDLRTAPRDFEVLGSTAMYHNDTFVPLTSGRYDISINAQNHQKFVLEEASGMIPIRRVMFKFLNNHGNSRYTCIYRLQVYGTPV